MDIRGSRLSTHLFVHSIWGCRRRLIPRVAASVFVASRMVAGGGVTGRALRVYVMWWGYGIDWQVHRDGSVA